MWELERDGTVGFQCSLESLSEIINVRHMSIDIVTHPIKSARRPHAQVFRQTSLKLAGTGTPTLSAAMAVLAVGSFPTGSLRPQNSGR